MAGRKKIPTKLKVLKGTQRADRLSPNEPEFENAEVSPTALIKGNEYALEEWQRVAPGLISTSVLGNVQVGTLERYCIAHSFWRQASEAMSKSGLLTKSVNGHIQPSPWVSVENKYSVQANKLAVELGLTPASQSKVSVPQKKKKTADPFAKLG